MMVAMAYVLVLAIVALEVPLALSLRERSTTRCRSRRAAVPTSWRCSRTDGARERETRPCLQDLVTVTSRDTRGRIVIVDDKGEVARRQRRRGSRSEHVSPPGRRSRPRLDGEPAQISTARARRSAAICSRRPCRSPTRGETTGAVRVTQDVADESERVPAHGRRACALIGLAVLLVGLVAGTIIARQIARPLRRFEGPLARWPTATSQARAPVEGSSEQRELARTFNEMTDRLSSSLEGAEPLRGRRLAPAAHAADGPAAAARGGPGARATTRT